MQTRRRFTTRLARRARLALLALTLGGCRDAPVDVPALVLTLSPAALSCTAGDTVSVAVSVAGAASPPTLSYAARGAHVAGSPSAGVVDVACGAAGAAEVTVTATTEHQSAMRTVPITVTPAPPLTVRVQPAELACRVGETAEVSAVVGDNVVPSVSVTFTPSNAHAMVVGSSVGPGGTSATVRCMTTGLVTIAANATAGFQTGTAGAAVSVSPPPQTVVLFATPKFMADDFAAPEAAVDRFLAHYAPLTSRAAETVVIFAVGNSQHILTYRGAAYGRDTVAWARYTNGKKTFDQILRYEQLGRIVSAFKARGAAQGLKVKVYDQIDPGNEMAWEFWKFDVHPECMDLRWVSFDIRGRLKPDTSRYASAPAGAPAGKLCGEFIADQAAAYMKDVGFDGILYGNQFGTRGRWLPDSGDGYSGTEAAQIKHFLDYSRAAYAGREIMWFDSYNNVRVEHDTWSFPAEGYASFDYIMASGFCVITEPARYVDDLESKLALPNRPKVVATLDYVDPWYEYNSMTEFPDESKELERIAIRYRDRIDGVVFFANDDRGALVPADLVASFAQRFYDVR